MKIYVTLETLRLARACQSGVEFAIPLIQEDGILEWDVYPQLWFAVNVPRFFAWCVENNVLPMLPLSNMNLDGVQLQGAYLENCNLSGSSLIGADLTGAYLVGCDITGTDFTDAILTGVVWQ